MFHKLKLCIVAHNSYGAMKGGHAGHAGGVEHQTSMTARWFAGRGHTVSLLTWDEGGEQEQIIDGVKLFSLCSRGEGLKGLRFFYPRWSSLIKAMARADADIYYHNGAEYVTGQIALWCRNYNRRFVFSVASDMDCRLDSPDTQKLYVRYLYRYGLRKADRIIVQTENQKNILLENYGLQSLILPMPCLCPLDSENRTSYLSQHKKRVLWVGRIDREKRLELLLEVAEAMPDVIFDVAGKPSDPESPYSIDVLDKASKYSNVIVHGLVPRSRMADLYRNASILCCTSLYEGFPNVFLEAWSCGIPIVSTFDPDNLIEEKKLGVRVHDSTELILNLRDLLGSDSKYRSLSQNARQYYEDNHELNRAMMKFEKLYYDLKGAQG